MSRTWRRLFIVAFVMVTTALGMALPASAHPLGNFSVNHANDIVVSPSEVRITHVVDLAEIPTVQAMPAIDGNQDQVASIAELGAFATERCAADAGELTLTVGGSPVTLRGGASAAALSEGQAGLNTLRVECELSGEVAIDGASSLQFVDAAAAESTGWSEVTLRADEVTLTDADVPTTSPTAALTVYPSDRESSPMRISGATSEVSPGGAPLVVSSDRADQAEGFAPLQWAAEVLGRTSSAATGPLGMVLALVIALVVGAAHALAPGHGKSLVAFALAGREERAGRAALTVGVTVTATHTASVLVLGLVVAGSATVVPAGIYPALSLITGVVIVGMGGVLLRNALRGGGHGHAHPHEGDPGSGYSHVAGHSHPHTHGHSHDNEAPHAVTTLVAPHDNVPASSIELPRARRGVLVALGVTGGLLPSPSAVVVLLAAVAAGRAWYGVLLVLAFGVGMAVTLAGVGFAVLRGQQRLLAMAERSPRASFTRVLRWVPVATASVVLAVGMFMVAAAL
ncbi:MAG: sulfite exporter TauE/SafE family protein [Actinomycetes bacterium]